MALNQEGKVVPDLPANKFHSIVQTPTVDVGPDGRVVSGVKISFKTELGVDSSVFIPDAQYSVNTVKGTIAAKAHQVDLVQQLRG